MFNITKKSIEWGGRTLTLETGRIARQADGAVLVTYGETVVLCAVTAAKAAKPDIDFFPLTVNYIEKTYAAGKIPGGFFKREGKQSEKEVLVSRLIDRPIRPLFAEGFYNEVQVVCTVLSHDIETDSDIPALVGSSAALALAGVPFMGPVGGSKVGRIDGQWVLNPTKSQLEVSDLDLVVAGTRSSVLMVESQAKELNEEQMLEAVMFGHKGFQPVIDLIIALAEEAAKDAWDFQSPEYPAALVAGAKEIAEKPLRAAYGITSKQDRVAAIGEAKKAVKEKFVGSEEEGKFSEKVVGSVLKKLEQDIVRTAIAKDKQRIDGRNPEQIRPITCEVGILPRTHGSALFTRGETQAIVVTTLGTSQDEQMIDAIDGKYDEPFMLHYNFPPYSVGEAGPLRPPGRREQGHGKLAWRALRPLLPTKEAFPYSIRVVSEITESNGSSSMASVCGGSLAMMNAGVPLTSPVAGIAMGLVLEGKDYTVLSDIMGDEDHLGDMDFKVAGTENGITALQMDIKINGITEEIMKVALRQAKAGRIHILGEMAKALTAPQEMSSTAPRITSLKVPVDKIREVIGSGGKVIREITETTGTKIDILEDGTINIFATTGEAAEAAHKWISGIVAVPEIGKIYDGKVVRIVDFGAFVNFIGGMDGLVHISEMADHRVNQVTDVVNEGDMVKVKVLEIDGRGKVRLSMKVVDQKTGEDQSDQYEMSGKTMRRKRPAGEAQEA